MASTVSTRQERRLRVALGLNLVIGYSGQLSLGHSAFVGLGAIAHLAVCLAAGLIYLAAIYALREPFQLTALGRSGRRQEGVGDDLSSVVFAPGEGPEAQIPARLAALVGERLPDTSRWMPWIGVLFAAFGRWGDRLGWRGRQADTISFRSSGSRYVRFCSSVP